MSGADAGPAKKQRLRIVAAAGPLVVRVPADATVADACAAAEERLRGGGELGKRRVRTFLLPDGRELCAADRIADAATDRTQELQPVFEVADAGAASEYGEERAEDADREAKRRKLEHGGGQGGAAACSPRGRGGASAMPHCAAGPGVDGVPAVCCTAAAHGMAYQAEIEGPKRVCTAHGVGGLADHLPPAPAAHFGATSRPAQGPQRRHGDQAVASGSSGVGADGCSPAVRCGARGGRLCGLFHLLRCSRRRTLVAAPGPRVRRCPAAGTGASGACAALRRV